MKLLLFLTFYKTISASVSDISNHNGYDFSHLPTGISTFSDRNHLIDKVKELEEAFKTQSGRHVGQDYFFQTMVEVLEFGAEPVDPAEFLTEVEDEIVVVKSTQEYILHQLFPQANITTSRKRRSRPKRDLNCVGCTVPLDLRDLEHYGCWCNMGSTLMDGQSTPLDDFDRACKVLQLGLRCVGMDNEGRAQPDVTCDPRVNLYNVPFFFFGGLENACSMANVGTFCSWKYCMCQTNWVNTVLDLSFNLKVVDHSLKHSDAGFDYDTRCPVAKFTTKASVTTAAPGGGGGGNNPTQPPTGGPGFQNGGIGDGIPNPFIPNPPNTFASTNAITTPTAGGPIVHDDCCGNYPARMPYSTSRHQCCDSAASLFDPNLSVCCNATNSVADLGNC